jgi:hypothetical protein
MYLEGVYSSAANLVWFASVFRSSWAGSLTIKMVIAKLKAHASLV